MKDDLGLEARRRGRVLEVKIDVNLDSTTATKTFRALYEVEKSLYEAKLKQQKKRALGATEG